MNEPTMHISSVMQKYLGNFGTSSLQVLFKKEASLSMCGPEMAKYLTFAIAYQCSLLLMLTILAMPRDSHLGS